MTDDNDITLTDIEQTLSEQRLDQEIGQAEVIDVLADRDGDREGLIVTFGTASGEEVSHWLPVPEHYEPRFSDLVLLLEFTDTDPNDLGGLSGERVPWTDEGIPWETMRSVVLSDVIPEDADYLEQVRDRL